MKPKHVGDYYLGFESVALYVTEGRGGSFETSPNTGETGRIDIGIEAGLQFVTGILEHEAWEFCLTRRNCRYRASLDASQSRASFLFVFTHAQFAQISADVGEFMANCIIAFRKARKNAIKEIKAETKRQREGEK